MKESSDKIRCPSVVFPSTTIAFMTYSLTISRTIHLEWAWTTSFRPELSSLFSHLIYPPVPLSAKDTCPFPIFLSSPNSCLIPLGILILVISSPRPDFARVVATVTFLGIPLVEGSPSSTKLLAPAIPVLSTHMCLFGFYTFLPSSSPTRGLISARRNIQVLLSDLSSIRGTGNFTSPGHRP